MDSWNYTGLTESLSPREGPVRDGAHGTPGAAVTGMQFPCKRNIDRSGAPRAVIDGTTGRDSDRDVHSVVSRVATGGIRTVDTVGGIATLEIHGRSDRVTQRPEIAAGRMIGRRVRARFVDEVGLAGGPCQRGGPAVGAVVRLGVNCIGSCQVDGVVAGRDFEAVGVITGTEVTARNEAGLCSRSRSAGPCLGEGSRGGDKQDAHHE